MFKKRQKSPEEIEYAQQRSESLCDVQTQKLSQEMHHKSGGLSPHNRESWNNMFEIRQDMSETTLRSNPHLQRIDERGPRPSTNQLELIKEATNSNRGPVFGQRSYSVSKQRMKLTKIGTSHRPNRNPAFDYMYRNSE